MRLDNHRKLRKVMRIHKDDMTRPLIRYMLKLVKNIIPDDNGWVYVPWYGKMPDVVKDARKARIAKKSQYNIRIYRY